MWDSMRKGSRGVKSVSLSLLVALGIGVAGCGSSDEVLLPSQGGAPAGLPVARADAYSTTFETPLSVPAATGVLVNDSPNAGNGQAVGVNFQSTSLNGGQVTLTNNAGAFTYTPPSGFVGVDTFGYELLNGFGVSRTTVTVQVTRDGPGVFVDSRTGNDGTGDAATGVPFATVQAAIAAAGPGGDIVVFPGQGTYLGQVNLLNGQRLLGIKSALVNAQGVVRPTFAGPIVLADGNTVDSVRVVGTSGIAIDADGQNSGTITNCEVANNFDGTGIQLRGIAGNWRIESNTAQGIDGIGIDMDTQGSQTAVVLVNRNSITDSFRFGLGMAAFAQSRLTVQVNNNTLTGNGPGLGPNKEAVGVLCPATDTGVLNLQFVGNQNDALYAFLQTGGSTINVERFAQFGTLNTGTAVVLQGQVNDVADIPGI